MSNIPASEAKWGPGAEQDRYASRFGVNASGAAESIKSSFSGGSGAEQDRYGSHWGLPEGTPERIGQKIKDTITSGPGAEQDRYGSYWGLRDETVSGFKRHFPSGPGAEQDRYASHLGGVGEKAAEKIKGAFARSDLTSGSGAEQDRYGSHWGVPDGTGDRIKSGLTSGPGAEQDRYASRLGGAGQEAADKIKSASRDAADKIKGAFSGNDLGPGAEQDRYGSRFGVGQETIDNTKDAVAARTRGGMSTGAEQDRYASHFKFGADNPLGTASVGFVGILRSTILPSFAVHSGVSLIAYVGGRLTDRVDAKDLAWPAAPVINAWWSAIGRRVIYYGVPLSTAWSDLSYPEKLLLGGVTAWGTRLFYRVATRAASRETDDPRYKTVKKENGFWNKAAVSLFLPEAIIQTLISLPFTLPFRLTPLVNLTPAPAVAELAHNLAIFLFASGFALEVLADSQLASFQNSNATGLNREGVWSIVRHPNYLGDVHIHAAFPLLLYSCGLLHPLALLGPVANYAFLRYIGGEKQTEEDQESRYQTEDPKKYSELQEYKAQKNSFWPKIEEYQNPWLLTVAGAGVAAAVVERVVREYLLR